MKYYLSLGSNKGNKRDNLNTAFMELEQVGEISNRSGYYETEPVGLKEQDDFLNTVCVLHSNLRPFRLLLKLKQIESRLGRTPAVRWDARIIDIDILDWSGEAIVTDTLTIPHSRMNERGFVLVPLQEAAPDYKNRQGHNIQTLINNLESNQRIKRID